MATTRGRKPTYHVVPNFNMAAVGGEIFLGAVLEDLTFDFPPLNRLNYFVEIPDELHNTPLTQTGFCETNGRIREGRFEAWLEVLIGLRGSASVSGSNDSGETVSCDSVEAISFEPDPDKKYLSDTFAKKPIQEFVENSWFSSATLYMVTGLKIATNLKYNGATIATGQAGAQVRAQAPQAGQTGGGAGVNAGGENRRQLEFSATDIVVGYRVRKYRCKRGKRSDPGEMDFKDKGLVPGEMMGADGAIKEEYKEPEMEFEEMEIPEETVAQERAAADGADECWVIPDGSGVT